MTTQQAKRPETGRIQDAHPMKCRHCAAPLALPLIDLGSAPPSNAYLRPDDLHGPETWYPLRVLVCEHCWLVQTEDFARAESLFSADYAYFSSVSSSWLEHAQRYVARSIERFALGPHGQVVEVAANDGYLLQYVQARGIPCTGIEPTASTAAASAGFFIPLRTGMSIRVWCTPGISPTEPHTSQ